MILHEVDHPTAPVTDIMNDLGHLAQGMTLVAPMTEFKAGGTFTLHHPSLGNISFRVDSGDPIVP